MADISPSPESSDRREQLSATIAGQALSLATDNLPMVLLLLGAFGGGLVVAWMLFAGQQTGRLGLLEMTKAIRGNQDAVLRQLQDHQEKVLELLRHQTETLTAKIDQQAAEWNRRLLLHDYNTGREPQDKLPLNGPLPRDVYPGQGR